MITKTKRSTTSLKIPETLYEDFKVTCVRSKMNLQDVVERALFLYLTDEEFRKTIYNQVNTYYTGSENPGSIK
ncbi:MAG: hypothetical protein WCO84_05445 [bacterium]